MFVSLDKVLAAVFDEHLAYFLVIDYLRQRQFVVAEIYQHHLVIGIGQKTAQRVRKRVSYYKKIVLSFTGRGVLRYVSQRHLCVVAVEKDRIFIQLFKPVLCRRRRRFSLRSRLRRLSCFRSAELYGIRLGQPEPRARILPEPKNGSMLSLVVAPLRRQLMPFFPRHKRGQPDKLPCSSSGGPFCNKAPPLYGYALKASLRSTVPVLTPRKRYPLSRRQ